MIAYLPFIFKSLAVSGMCFYWARELERSRSILIVLSFLLLFLFMSSLPFGYIDVVSGDYVESGSLLLILTFFFLQSMISQLLEKSRVNLVLDIVLPLTLLSAMVRYGTFNMAIIASKQSNLSSLGIPQVGFVYDPVNAILFYWLCFIKFKNIQLKKHMSGQLPYQLSSEFHLNSSLLLGFFFFFGGIPGIGVFNIVPIYNDLIQSIGAVAIILIYLYLMRRLMSFLTQVFFPLSEEVIEQSIWTRFVPISIIFSLLSMGVFVVTGGRF